MNTCVYIIGLPFFSKKYCYHCAALTLNSNVTVEVLLNSDLDGYCGPVPERTQIKLCGKSHYKRLVTFTKELKKNRPLLLEIYDYSILTLFYILIAKIFRVKTRLWIIGAELLLTDIGGNYYITPFLSPIRNVIKYFMTKASLFFVDHIAVKEFHHLSELEKTSSCLLKKTDFIYNSVPCFSFKPKDISERPKYFLYANSVEPTRNVLELVTALNELKFYGFKSTIVGLDCIKNEGSEVNTNSYSKKIYDFVNLNNLNTSITLKPFLPDVSQELELHRFFVFPAMSVFANYALLEAMERGLIPIVLDGLGYEEIVIDNFNGIVIREMDIRSALEKALRLNDCDVKKMSIEARNMIVNKFSFDTWSKKVNSIIKG